MAKLPPINSEANPSEINEDRDAEINQLNSPKIDEETGEPSQRAVSSFKQAHGICKRQFDLANESRLKVAAVVADKYGGSAPYKSADLKTTGQLWRNNFSTNPLGSVTDRSTPQLTDPLKAAEFLTYSSLPAEREEAADKTRKFRARTTKLVRSWSGFPSLMSQIAQEDYLYGNAAPGWIDDDWRPRMFRFDEAFLPDGSAQHAGKTQFIVYRQDMLLHDFLQKIEDKQTAEDAGYNLKGCYKAANEAAEVNRNGSTGDTTPMEMVDAMRESGTLGYTYQGQTKIIRLFHLLVREYEGGVNLWTTTQGSGGHGIRVVENIHESMEDACSLFTLQEGNSRYYGSKGAGRMLANLHIALDRARNLAQDQVYLTGLLILQSGGKQANDMQAIVRHPFLVVPDGATVVKEQIAFDWQGYQWMDSHLSGIMETLAGSFIQSDISADGKAATTKIEAAQNAERQLAVKNGVLGRWFSNFADMMGAMQRKIYKPDNLKEGQRLFEENEAKEKKGMRVIAAKVFNWLKGVISGFEKNASPMEQSAMADSDAVQCIVDLLHDGLTVEDIAELALSPAGNSVEEQPEEQDQKTTAYIDAQMLGPQAIYFDRKAAAKMSANIVLGEDRANAILLPDQEDPTNEAIATRTQLSEWLIMKDSAAVPVAATDLHKIHRQVMQPMLGPIVQLQEVSPTRVLNEFMKLALQHYADHVAMDKDLSDADRAQEEQGIKDYQQVILNADKKLDDQDAQAQAAGVPGGGQALPPPVNGAPMGATGPGGAMAGTDGDLDRQKLQAETALRAGDQEIQHRKLDLEQQKLHQAQEEHTSTLAMSALTEKAKQVGDAIHSGIDDGNQALALQSKMQNPNPPSPGE